MNIDVITLISKLGIEFFAIGGLIYTVKLCVGVFKNHMAHNTKAMEKLSASIDLLIQYLQARDQS